VSVTSLPLCLPLWRTPDGPSLVGEYRMDGIPLSVDAWAGKDGLPLCFIPHRRGCATDTAGT
jgi:hypothetical protein